MKKMDFRLTKQDIEKLLAKTEKGGKFLKCECGNVVAKSFDYAQDKLIIRGISSQEVTINKFDEAIWKCDKCGKEFGLLSFPDTEEFPPQKYIHIENPKYIRMENPSNIIARSFDPQMTYIVWRDIDREFARAIITLDN